MLFEERKLISNIVQFNYKYSSGCHKKWDRDWNCDVGLWMQEGGTRGHEDAGTWGCGAQGCGDTQGLEDVLKDLINKQHIDFCTEFVK